MLTRTVAIIVALGSIAIAAPIAQGARHKHQLKLTIKDSTITSQGDRPGNKQTTAGLISGKPFEKASNPSPTRSRPPPAR